MTENNTSFHPRSDRLVDTSPSREVDTDSGGRADAHELDAMDLSNSTENSTPEIEHSLDVIFEILSNTRRRAVCRRLAATPDGMTLRELAVSIAAEENDVSETDLTYDERKRLYIPLYQNHLPKMDDLNVVDFDEDRKTVDTGSYFPLTLRCLHQVSSVIADSYDSSSGGSTNRLDSA